MRLIKTGPYQPGHYRLEVKEVASHNVPPYTILSHTWDADPANEVLFADIQDAHAAEKKGFAKLKYAFDQSVRDGYGWVWIDTCCINKDSSAELSEAINSMYVWYQRAAKCYAYMEGVPSDTDMSARQSLFTMSKWFTRGWTLQVRKIEEADMSIRMLIVLQVSLTNPESPVSRCLSCYSGGLPTDPLLCYC